MKNTIVSILENEKTTTIDIYELEKKTKEILGENIHSFFYKELADVILGFEDEGKIEKFKSSKQYSRDVRIQTKYRKKYDERTSKQEIKREILTHYHPKMKLSFYIKDLKQYELDKNNLKSISQFLAINVQEKCFLSVNERSYELFENEKLLNSNKGKKVLANIGITYDDLRCFETYEPFFHYGLAQRPNDNILIIENKDTFFSLKKLFLEGYTSWFGVRFEMLIYGEGNKITKAINYLEELQVPVETQIYYFGDFDPEGFAILHRIREKTERKVTIWKPLYIELWKRRKNTKLEKKQIWNDASIRFFLQSFDIQLQKEMEVYLKEQRYIPQEAVHINLLRSLSDGFK